MRKAPVDQMIEPVDAILKGQFDLEHHGGGPVGVQAWVCGASSP